MNRYITKLIFENMNVFALLLISHSEIFLCSVYSYLESTENHGNNLEINETFWPKDKQKSKCIDNAGTTFLTKLLPVYWFNIFHKYLEI